MHRNFRDRVLNGKPKWPPVHFREPKNERKETMKAVKIVAIFIFGGLALFFILIMWRGMFRGTWSWWVGGTRVETGPDYKLVQEKELPAESIDSLEIRYRNFMSVIFYENSDDTILIREYLNFTPSNKQLSEIKTAGDTVTVQGPKTNFYTGSFLPAPNGYTEIWLPSKIYDSLSVQTVSGDIRSDFPLAPGALTANSTSGDITFPDLESDRTSVSTISGDILLSSVSGASVSLSTTSGNIVTGDISGESNVSTTSGDITTALLGGGTVSTTSGEVRITEAEKNLSVNSVSGDVRVESLNAPFRFNTTSGEIIVENGSGSGKASSVSGDIRLSLTDALTGNLTLNTTSGDIVLALPETSAFYLDFDSTSGSCNTFFDDRLSFNKRGNQASGEYGSNSENKLNVSTTSGDLRITKAD